MSIGIAIAEAIRLKMESGGVASKKKIAEYFLIEPPSIHDWIKKGSISKDKLPKLFEYFSDVVGPEHWGLKKDSFLWENDSDLDQSNSISDKKTGASPILDLSGLPVEKEAFMREMYEKIKSQNEDEFRANVGLYRAAENVAKVEGKSINKRNRKKKESGND